MVNVEELFCNVLRRIPFAHFAHVLCTLTRATAPTTQDCADGCSEQAAPARFPARRAPQAALVSGIHCIPGYNFPRISVLRVWQSFAPGIYVLSHNTVDTIQIQWPGPVIILLYISERQGKEYSIVL